MLCQIHFASFYPSIHLSFVSVCSFILLSFSCCCKLYFLLQTNSGINEVTLPYLLFSYSLCGPLPPSGALSDTPCILVSFNQCALYACILPSSMHLVSLYPSILSPLSAIYPCILQPSLFLSFLLTSMPSWCSVKLYPCILTSMYPSYVYPCILQDFYLSFHLF